MGLDQYAYSRAPVGTADFRWRKHPNLHGWMERLWEERYKTEQCEWDSFNGVELRLEKADILQLRSDILCLDLPATEGFFFGNDADDYYEEQDLKFCSWALEEIDQGREVYYDSSW